VRKLRYVASRHSLAVAVACVVLLVASSVAAAAIRDFLRPHPYGPKVLHVSGKIRMSNSRNGTSILTMDDMRPGDSASGTVVIGNRSKVRGDFWLKKARLVDRIGPNSGPLSRCLLLQVTEKLGTRPPRVLYRGSMAKMPTIYLGAFRAKTKKRYLFTLSFPDQGSTLDNLFQGSAVRVDFRWYASRLH
jgi:hypothetical protein